MTEQYWPKGQHRIQPSLTCGQCSKLTMLFWNRKYVNLWLALSSQLQCTFIH